MTLWSAHRAGSSLHDLLRDTMPRSFRLVVAVTDADLWSGSDQAPTWHVLGQLECVMQIEDGQRRIGGGNT